MWSLFKKIFRQISGADSGFQASSLFPQNVDKLREEFSATEELDGPGGPITAREAFELAEELISGFDDTAKLVSIESRGRLDEQGRAGGWLFQFQLPRRWGHAIFAFKNDQPSETVELKITPFAGKGGAMDQMLSDGQDGFVEQQWKVEMERQPCLSHQFRDSTSVLDRLAKDGKAVDHSGPIVLKASTPPLGQARWELFESSGSKKSLYKLPIE